MNLLTLGASCEGSHTVFALWWLSYFVYHKLFKVHPCGSRSQNVSFSRPNNIPFCVFCVSLHPPTDAWVVFTFWQMLLWTWACECIGVPAFNSFGYNTRSRSAGSHGNIMFNFLRTLPTVLHSGLTILHCHLPCTGAQVSLQPTLVIFILYI